MWITYLVPTRNLAPLAKKLDSLVRRAAKLGCSLAYEVHSDVFRRPHPTYEGTWVGFAGVTIQGETPRVNGWEFVGTLQHVGSGVLFRTVPGDTIPRGYQDASPDNCDHCGKHRRRVDTYVVRDETTGETKQVGKTCLGDFLGHHNPHGAAKLATYLAELGQSIKEMDWEAEGGGELAVDPLECLSFAAALIQRDGWVSRGTARDEGGEATADDAWHHCFFCTAPGCRPHHVTPDGAHKEAAAKALAWARELDTEDSDYLYNCRVVAGQLAWTAREVGIGVSILVAHRRAITQALEQARRAEQAANSSHVGQVGKRDVFSVTLEFQTSWDGHYGTTWLYRFADAKGNVLVWRSSRNKELDLGQAVTLKGTVKAHDEYKGVAQTVLTRCAVQ